MKLSHYLIGLATGSVLCTASAFGAIVNGGFETGDFTGWTPSINAASSAASFILARDPLNAGLQPPFDNTWHPASGNYFAALWSTDNQGNTGSLLTVDFVANAGDVLEFDYFFDYGDFNPLFDWSRGTLLGSTGTTVLFAHNTSIDNQLPDDTNIDWTHSATTITRAGLYTLNFSVGDADGTFESILGIDNVTITPAPASALALLGICAFAPRRRR